MIAYVCTGDDDGSTNSGCSFYAHIDTPDSETTAVIQIMTPRLADTNCVKSGRDGRIGDTTGDKTEDKSGLVALRSEPDWVINIVITPESNLTLVLPWL